MKNALLILSLLIAFPSMAQDAKAILTGLVRSRDGTDTLKYFMVRVINVETGRSFYRWSDDSTGNFEFKDLPVGIYNLYCSNWMVDGTVKIRNVVLKEGFNNWYPRISATYHSLPDNPVRIRQSYYEDSYTDELDFEEEILIDSLGLYPNPVRDLAFLSEAQDFSHVEIFSLSGLKMKEFDFAVGAERKMWLEDLPFGVYICKLDDQLNNYSKTIKFLKI